MDIRINHAVGTWSETRPVLDPIVLNTTTRAEPVPDASVADAAASARSAVMQRLPIRD